MWERREDQGSRKHTPAFLWTAAACESTPINQALVNVCVCMCNKGEEKSENKDKVQAGGRAKCICLLNSVLFLYLSSFSLCWPPSVFLPPQFGRTEVIDNTLNPDFVRKYILDYFFEEKQSLRFDLWVKSDNHGIFSPALCPPSMWCIFSVLCWLRASQLQSRVKPSPLTAIAQSFTHSNPNEKKREALIRAIHQEFRGCCL